MKTCKIINIKCNAVEMQEDEALSRALQVVNSSCCNRKKENLGFWIRRRWLFPRNSIYKVVQTALICMEGSVPLARTGMLLRLSMNRLAARLRLNN